MNPSFTFLPGPPDWISDLLIKERQEMAEDLPELQFNNFFELGNIYKLSSLQKSWRKNLGVHLVVSKSQLCPWLSRAGLSQTQLTYAPSQNKTWPFLRSDLKENMSTSLAGGLKWASPVLKNCSDHSYLWVTKLFISFKSDMKSLPCASHTLFSPLLWVHKHLNIVSGTFSTERNYRSYFKVFSKLNVTGHFQPESNIFRRINTYADSSCCIQSTFRRTFTSERAWSVFAYPINAGIRFALVNICKRSTLLLVPGNTNKNTHGLYQLRLNWKKLF